MPMDASTLVALPTSSASPTVSSSRGSGFCAPASPLALRTKKDRSVLGFFGLGLLIGPLAIVAAVRRPVVPTAPATWATW